MDEKLTLFIAVTSAAVVLQMLIMLFMFFTLRALSRHLKTAADEIKAQAFPVIESGKAIQADIKRILETSAPKVELVLDNAAAITTTAHAGIGRVESTVNDMLDRARLQVAGEGLRHGLGMKLRVHDLASRITVSKMGRSSA